MEEEEKRILLDILNSITRTVLYRYARRELQIQMETNAKKEEIVDLIFEDVQENVVHRDHLYNFVNKVQEWGRQHVYLFRSNPQTKTQFRKFTTQQIQEYLTDHRTGLKTNHPLPIFMPEQTGFKAYKVVHEEGRRLAIFWAEKRVLYTRNEERDYIDKNRNLEFRAWSPRNSRGLLIMDWDLLTGQVMIRVSQADAKSVYENARDEAFNYIQRIFNIQANEWTNMDIRRAIANIKDSGTVSTKKYNQESQSGGKQSLQARDKRTGIEHDTELTQAGRAIVDRFASTYGNFYWSVTEDDGSEIEVHTTIESKSNSLLIYGIQTEETVRYILGEIIKFSR